MKKSTRILVLPLLYAGCAGPNPMHTKERAERPFSIEIEAGALSQNRNDVRIRGDSGTRYSLSDLIGEGSYPIARITADWDIDGRHALRAVFAPIEFDGTGTLTSTTAFAGETFAPGVRTEASYKFSSYRLGYRYTFHESERWRLRAGGTLFVRDAEIELQQGATRSSDSDVGIVPLANLAVEYRPSDRWRVLAELDGLAASQGRAFDFTLGGRRDLGNGASVGLAYRTIEGGADNDEVFNFAWLNSIVATLSYRF